MSYMTSLYTVDNKSSLDQTMEPSGHVLEDFPIHTVDNKSLLGQTMEPSGHALEDFPTYSRQHKLD